MLYSTRNKAKNTGDCAKVGRHEANGFVPCFRYSAIISRLIASREAGSCLPLYFFCSAWSSGESICIPRAARICLTNSGIKMIRMMMTRPTIDSAQDRPESDSRPSQVSRLWNCTMIQATATFNGHRIVSNQVNIRQRS